MKTNWAWRIALLLLLTPFFTEGFLRIFLGRPHPRVWTPGMNVNRGVADLIDPAKKSFYRFQTNSFGVRGPEPKAKQPVILFLGSSTTEGEGISNDSTWPELAVRIFNQKNSTQYACMNAARSGMLLPHNLLHLEILADDLIEAGHSIKAVVVMPGAGDLQNFISSRQAPVAIDDMNASGRATLFNQAFPGSNTLEPESPWYKNNLTWFYASQLKARLFSFGQEQRKSIDHHRKREIRKRSTLVDMPPEKAGLFPKFLNAYRKDLERLSRFCESRNLPLVLISQPIDLCPTEKNLWNSGLLNARFDTLSEAVVARHGSLFVKDKDYAEELDSVNQITKTIAQRFSQATYIDLSDSLSMRPAVFYDTFHFTAVGCAAAAEMFTSQFALK